MILANNNFNITYHNEDEKDKIESLLKDILNSSTQITCNTSGSTGKPKKIVHSKASLVISAKKTISYFNLKENDSAALCLSVNHIGGIMMVVRAMVAGLHLHVYHVAKQSIDDIKEQIDFIAFVPLQMEYAMKNKERIQKIKRIKKILIGGAPISLAMNELLEEHQISVFQSYGMTETISHVALKRSGYKGVDYYTALDGISFGINNEALTISYPEINKEIIQTNDCIALIDNSSFRWLGRLDYVINTGGIKISPEILEKKLCKTVSTPFIISSLPDRELGEKIVIILKENKFKKEEVLKDNLRKQLTNYEVPKAYSLIKDFVFTQNGKINRLKTMKIASDCGWEKLL